MAGYSFLFTIRFFILYSALYLKNVAGFVVGSRVTAHAAIGNATHYDYVIVGGGLTGLVVANRLTEDSTKNVLVIEYGYIDNSSLTLIPYDANDLNTADMFSNLVSTPQSALNNKTFEVWVGAVVGGGSIVNGMEYDRGAAADYDAWESLGNPGWGWADLLPYFRKSTTFTPPSNATFVAENGITWNTSAYGNGPVQASIAPFQYPELPTFWKAWDELNTPKPIEAADGHAVGTFWSPSSLDAKTETRSSARTAYYDPVATRPNLHLLTGHTVTEILFHNNLTAYGVKITSRADNTSSIALANKEIVMAAGAVHTPQLLQLSGIGPRDVLEAAGVPVKLDAPAVGANFQDHPVAYITFNLTNNTTPNTLSLTTNATYNASAYAQYLSSRTGPYTQAHGNSVSFLSLPSITNSSALLAQSLLSQNATAYLPSIYTHNPSLLAGYLAQRTILASRYTSTNASIYEFPFNGGGSTVNALQKPASRGTITLDPANPSGPPLVDYSVLTNPVDAAIFALMIRYTRTFFATRAMAVFAPVEVAPGAAAQTDAQILAALKAEGLLQPSFAHPCASCAMLPRELGGCVDSALRVYGTSGLSVVDASVVPLIVGAHLQETMYAVAEKAADLIKARA